MIADWAKLPRIGKMIKQVKQGGREGEREGGKRGRGRGREREREKGREEKSWKEKEGALQKWSKLDSCNRFPSPTSDLAREGTFLGGTTPCQYPGHTREANSHKTYVDVLMLH